MSSHPSSMSDSSYSQLLFHTIMMSMTLVANGAHYFLFGRVDENDPPGILREKGFGVEFPNYIVDVKKDPETGE